MASNEISINSADLIEFSKKLLLQNGLNDDKAQTVAASLVEADLMGHSTHGIRLLPAYLKELETGRMTASGEPEIISDFGAALTLDGNYLPGPWLVHKAIGMALERIKEFPVITIVIRKSHHIACLATYPERAIKQGLLMLLTCSDPDNRTVAPFGGITPVLGSNPIAAGIPGNEAPLIFDISTSETAGAQIQQAFAEGTRLPHASIISSEGSYTNDPHAFINNPQASIAPLGGASTGYKGTALSMLVESLTNGLSGFGRAKRPNRWCASVFLQIIDPKAFAGLDDFLAETEFLKEECKASKPISGTKVRLPGERALKLRNEQLKQGVLLSETLISYLKTSLESYNIPFPEGFNC